MIEILMILFFFTFLVGDIITTDLAMKLGRMTVGIKVTEMNPEHKGDTKVSKKMIGFKYVATFIGAIFCVVYQSLIGAIILVLVGLGLIAWNYRVIKKAKNKRRKQ